MTKNSLKQVARNIELLDMLKNRFDTGSTYAKVKTLQKLASAEIVDAALLERYHDCLCFIRAYPDNATIRELAEVELQYFHQQIESYKNESRDRQAKMLADTGIVNTSVCHEFSHELTRAAARWYADQVEIDWKLYNRAGKDLISMFLPLVVAWPENDTLDNDMETSTEEWLKLARGKSDKSGLNILLKIIEASNLPLRIRRHLFESAELPIRWDLTHSPASRTLKRIPAARTFYQKTPIRSRTKNLRATLKASPGPLKHLSLKQGKDYTRHIKEVLGVRCRELYSIIHAEPGEVYLYEPGRGIQIAVFGNLMDIRLPLESNFGAMLVRNGMPVGYGLACTCFERAEIGINTFPAFRTGESSYMVEQFFKMAYHYFASKVLLVRSYQLGNENEEALESGSFWFYYKLGFRPVDKKIRDLARREYEKIKADRFYRCPIRMLKRLSKCDVFFHIDPAKMDGYRELPLKNLGYAVTKHIAENFDGDRHLAIEMTVKKIARILSIKGRQRWSENEILSFKRLAPLIACIPDLRSWSDKEKALLARIIRAKGKVAEREFVLLCNKHKRFQQAIERLGFGIELDH
ncbi:MAG: hypothetical protein GY839_21665 [candidate division Zixibacteria bacterium]|nr:hypothetical protein [candidate division Zixibacteria bacterium]